MEIMFEKKDRDRFYLHAFCLMDNHVHLMLREGEKDDKDVAVEKYKAYMNEECGETFIDLKEEIEVMDEKEARELFQKMLMDQGIVAQIKN